MENVEERKRPEMSTCWSLLWRANFCPLNMANKISGQAHSTMILVARAALHAQPRVGLFALTIRRAPLADFGAADPMLKPPCGAPPKPPAGPGV